MRIQSSRPIQAPPHQKALRTAAGLASSVIAAPKTIVAPLAVASGSRQDEADPDTELFVLGGAATAGIGLACAHYMNCGFLDTMLTTSLISMVAVPTVALAAVIVSGRMKGETFLEYDGIEGAMKTERQNSEATGLKQEAQVLAAGYKEALQEGFNLGSSAVDGFFSRS